VMIDGRIGFVAVPHEQGGEAEGLGRAQVTQAVFDEQAFTRRRADHFQQSLVGLRARFVFKVHRADVYDEWEVAGDAEAVEDAGRVAAVGVGEDRFGLGQGGQHGIKGGVVGDVTVVVNLVDESEIGIWVHVGVIVHQSAQAGAIGQEIPAADVVDVRWIDSGLLDHKAVDALADLIPQAVARWVEGIVEIEDEMGDWHGGIIR